jgi:hypothetical protein
MKTQFRSLKTVTTCCVAGALLLGSAVLARNQNPRVFPINSSPYAKTYGEWSAEWWKWAFSLPVDQNPFFDEAGCANGANGQSGPVWFLTGVVNVSGSATRECTVPAGKAIFFPILNVECSVLEGNGTTEEELLACTEFYMDLVTDVFCEIDGVSVANMEEYRATSPLFTLGPLPDNNVFQFFGLDAPEGTVTAAVNQGFHLMLPPLAKGKHTLHYGGTFGDPINFSLDITYHLTIE